MNESKLSSEKYKKFIKDQDSRTVLNINKATQIRHFVENIVTVEGNIKKGNSIEQ